MIKTQSHCPYCNACVIAYDWNTDRIIFNPDHAKPHPCEHVTYVGVCCLTLGHLFAHRHTTWLHPTGDPLIKDFLRAIGDGTARPDATYKMTHAKHEYRHKSDTDSVTFCGVYAPDPKGFLEICSQTMRTDWSERRTTPVDDDQRPFIELPRHSRKRRRRRTMPSITS
jgi:hypothetical protein